MTPKPFLPEYPVRQVTSYRFQVVNMMAAERRAADGGELIRVEGQASVFNAPYEVYGGPQFGGWIEQVAPGAATETLSDRPDVVWLINHAGLPIARTTSGTLQLRQSDTGLDVGSYLDRRSSAVNDLLIAMERGDVNEMSFGFRVPRGGDVWSAHPDFPDDDQSLRTITEFNLNRGDVSSVTYGANPATDSGIVRSAAGIIRAIDRLDRRELAEVVAAVERRNMNSKPTPDGISGGDGRGGMPDGVTAVLALPLPPNPME